MKNRIILLTINSLINDRLIIKMESIFSKLDPSDLNSMVSIENGDYFKVILSFDIDKQIAIEKQLRELNILVKSEDITDSILNFDYSEDVLNIIYNNDYTLKVIEEFQDNNLDIDIILDKISLCGIDSLSKMEKNFLDNLDL